VNDKRPVNLDLTSLKYPPMAIVSILHRISGIALFLLMPVMLYLLNLSLRSEASFGELQVQLLNPWWKFVLWVFCSALVYHLLAGIRHIIMDLGWGETLSASRKTALGVVLLAVLSTVFLGVWIW
jgi:succinate dehydrogenase / fumarate reductase cytochrome b subunit